MPEKKFIIFDHTMSNSGVNDLTAIDITDLPEDNEIPVPVFSYYFMLAEGDYNSPEACENHFMKDKNRDGQPHYKLAQKIVYYQGQEGNDVRYDPASNPMTKMIMEQKDIVGVCRGGRERNLCSGMRKQDIFIPFGQQSRSITLKEVETKKQKFLARQP